MWSWIKRWFDPGTTSKIFILSAAEVEPTLTSFMEPSSIPKQYGGELEWKWGDMPNLDDPSRELLQGIEQPLAEGQTRKDILKGPVLFEGDHLQVLGTVDGKERREVIPVPQTQTQTQTQARKVESEAAPAATEAEAEAEKTGDVAPVDAEKKADDEKAVDNVAVKVNQLSVDEPQNAAA